MSVFLRYLGSKPYGLDSFAGTGTIWNGNGDIQPVPEEAAKILLKYPTVWAEVTVNQALQQKQQDAVLALKQLEGKEKLEEAKAAAKAAKAAKTKPPKKAAPVEPPAPAPEVPAPVAESAPPAAPEGDFQD